MWGGGVREGEGILIRFGPYHSDNRASAYCLEEGETRRERERERAKRQIEIYLERKRETEIS